MAERLTKALEDIHSIAFAARNQIAYWKRFNISPDVGSLKIALQGIIDLCEDNTPKEDIEDDEERQGVMTQEITAITVVPDSKAIFDYAMGDLGQPLKSQGHAAWMIRCPGCGNLRPIDEDKITKHEDGTVSSTQPLHCHGSKARQRYSIEHNEVKWL